MQPKIYEPDAYYRFNPFNKHWLATSGVMNFAETHQCYWLLDVIASYEQMLAIQDLNYMLVCELKLHATPIKSEWTDELCNATFTISHEVNGEKVIVQHQDIVFTNIDRPVKLWAINESMSGKYEPLNRTVLMLPEEY